MIEIPQNEKYATLALSVSHLRFGFTEPLDLGDDLWVSAEMPVAMPENWQRWLGSIRVDRLRDANFFLFSHTPTAQPRVLDADNQRLIDAIQRLYFALLMAVPYIGHEDDLLITGARHDDEIDVRRLVQYNYVLTPPGCHGAVVDDAILRLSKDIFAGLAHLQGGGEHSRVWRMVRAFHGALKENQFGARIHQFVRCIEGFVFPDEGQTKRQMISRTELFIGPRHHDLIRTLFDIRSAVEHLHGPNRVVTDPDPDAVILRLAELSYKAEAIARYCLRRLFTTRALWASFSDDTALDMFWGLAAPRRQALWGATMDTAAEFGHWDERNARIRLFSH